MITSCYYSEMQDNIEWFTTNRNAKKSFSLMFQFYSKSWVSLAGRSRVQKLKIWPRNNLTSKAIRILRGHKGMAIATSWSMGWPANDEFYSSIINIILLNINDSFVWSKCIHNFFFTNLSQLQDSFLSTYNFIFYTITLLR